jgi:hypothetical protein
MATQSSVLPVSDFGPRLKALKQLQQEATDAYRAAAGAILKFAVEYTALYKTVARNTAMVSRLNAELGLEDWQATRWRSIAAQAKPLKSIQRCMPSAFEPIYEVARSLREDEKNKTRKVLKAVESKTLTPSSTLREIASIRTKKAGSLSAQHGQSPKSSKIQVASLKSVGMTFLLPRDSVPRPDDIKELGDDIAKALAKFKARYVGFASPVFQQHLETYWTLKDEAATLKQSGTAEQKDDLEDRWTKLFEGGKVWS